MPNKHYRAHQRFAAKLPITVTSVYRNVASRGTTLDLGIGGAACEIDTPLRLGETVQVVITGEQPRVVCGEVAWVGWAESSAVRLGVRFDPASVEELEALLDAISTSTQVATAQLGA